MGNVSYGRSILIVLGLLFAVGALKGSGIYRFLRGPGGQPPNTAVQNIFYEVRPNTPIKHLSEELEKNGIITNASYFYWYARITGRSKKIKSADYRFTNRMSPNEVLSILTSGISYGVPLTVPEGYNIEQIAEVLDQIRHATHPGSGARFLALCKDPKFIATLGFSYPVRTLEGYLYPETYSVTRKMSEEEIIRQMLKKYRSVFTEEQHQKARALGMTEHQVVTMASIVEKETGAKQERPLIASVFHNRLKKKMRLQSDPTVIYGIKDYKGNITRKDLDTYTEYNTYRIEGLPPGPIANPGREAILAVLNPATSNYLYFVSHNDGTHEFTTTYENHLKAVSQFQLDPKAREGKSWRDLKKVNH